MTGPEKRFAMSWDADRLILTVDGTGLLGFDEWREAYTFASHLLLASIQFAQRHGASMTEIDAYGSHMQDQALAQIRDAYELVGLAHDMDPEPHAGQFCDTEGKETRMTDPMTDHLLDLRGEIRRTLAEHAQVIGQLDQRIHQLEALEPLEPVELTMDRDPDWVGLIMIGVSVAMLALVTAAVGSYLGWW